MTSNMSSSELRVKYWTQGETLLLLQLYMKHKEVFRGRHRSHAKVWKEIADEMAKYGVVTSYIKLDRKFRNMKRTYVAKRHNPDSISNWPYYDIMHEIFGNNLTIGNDFLTSDEDTENKDIKNQCDDTYDGSTYNESQYEESNYDANQLDIQYSNQFEPHIEIKSERSSSPIIFMDESNFDDLISNRAAQAQTAGQEEDNEDADVDVDSPYLNLEDELQAQRAEELRAIRVTLQEANRIQVERNEILKERNQLMREYLKTINKYK